MHTIKIFYTCLLISLFTPSVFSESLPDFPFVIATGEAEIEVKPDIAMIQLSIMAFEKESDLALKTLNITTTEVTKAVQKYKIDTDQIEATDIEKSVKRRRDGQYNNLEILGYEVSRSLTIKLKDLSKYSELMSDIVVINNVSNARASFELSNRKEVEANLVNMASRDANKKAKRLAESLGSKVDSIYAISQTSTFDSLMPTFGAGQGRPVMYDRSFRSESYSTVMFAPKTIKIIQGVNVVYRIK